ncbi:MAG: HIT domain-containing protein [Campylobacterota bacterium]|nr:HIT domain-containing protein [Campylobacterota bacterium]
MNDILYSPWRDTYVSQKKVDGCVFCNIATNGDDRLLFEDDYCFIVMNKYPYTPGHFMIIPKFHTDSLEELDPKAWQHISLLAQNGVALLKNVLNAQGVNLGMNLGAVSGAGIAQHIHLHLVPRWGGDVNFMTSICETRVYSTDFDEIFEKLKENSVKYFTHVTIR